MKHQLLFERIDNRVVRDKEDSDYAYFHALTLKLEYVTKLVTAGVVACIGDDADRNRYSLEHKLIRANSIGDWVENLNSALVGPPASSLDTNARSLTRDLTERVDSTDWRYHAVIALNQAAEEIGAVEKLGTKVALRQFFDIGTRLRNRSRGHGASTNEQCSKACPFLDKALKDVVHELKLFQIPWVYLHRNLSGKYRVSPLWGDASCFEYLKSERNVRLPDNGVFLYLDRPVYVPLVFSDTDVLDISLPNGNHRGNTFEALSYVTNQTTEIDGSTWSDPPARLPRSETEGETILEPLGNTFANLPPKPSGYILRRDLEERLKEELLRTDRHPIVSLTGPGGIGKTTIAIASIEDIAQLNPVPYQVVLWISARDIDLLESGPKSVSPQVITQQDISRAAVELLEPEDRSSNNFNPNTYFQKCLDEGAAGTTLFVLDNFETVKSPADVFNWIDTYIRPPNKVLITTRFRDFAGDYPIEIGGMTDEEASNLIDQHAKLLEIESLLNSTYKSELIRESDGHPYVMKVLLGQVAKEQRAVKPQRIMASADHLLKALFERTYGALSPAGQRVFLLLCSWRVFVPEVAVEAVSIRPGSERFGVTEALEELRRFSLVDQIVSKKEDELFVGVPLAAAIYGQQKLETSPFKSVVGEDRKLLMEFGAGKREDIHRGVLPRIERLVQTVAVRASASPTTLEESLPVLEYLAARVPKAYLQLADLVLEASELVDSTERAKGYIRSFLENTDAPDRQEAWMKLANLCQASQDLVGEIHALSEAALLPTTDQEDLGRFANRLNNRMRDFRGETEEVRGFLELVITAMEGRLKDLSATNCSRLAWLHLNVKNPQRALDVAKIGINLDSDNEHCQNLIRRLDT